MFVWFFCLIVFVLFGLFCRLMVCWFVVFVYVLLVWVVWLLYCVGVGSGVCCGLGSGVVLWGLGGGWGGGVWCSNPGCVCKLGYICLL